MEIIEIRKINTIQASKTVIIPNNIKKELGLKKGNTINMTYEGKDIWWNTKITLPLRSSSRKLQATGSNSLMVVLPKEWYNHNPILKNGFIVIRLKDDVINMRGIKIDD